MGNTTSCCVSSSPKLRRNAHSRLESYRPDTDLSREDTGCNLQHISDRENIDEWRLRPTHLGIMNIFDRKIDFDALLKFSHITPSTQQHLKKVYASFALCMFVAAAGAYVHVVTHFIQAGLLSALGSLGLMIWLMAIPHSHETEQKRLGLLAGFAFLTGIGLGPALELCIAINPSILPTAFMGTAMIFTCFSLSALYARRRSYLFLGGVLMS